MKAAMHVAMVGYGSWGKRLAAAIDRFTGLHLVAIHTRKPIEDSRYVSDYDRILADSSIEAMIIAAPTAVRPAYITAALQAHKHVLTEKPLSFSGETSGYLQALAQQTGQVLHVNYVHAHSPSLAKLRACWLEEKLHTLQIVFGQPGPLSSVENASQLLLSHQLAITAKIVSLTVLRSAALYLESYSQHCLTVVGQLESSQSNETSCHTSLRLSANMIYPERYRHITLTGKDTTIVADMIHTGRIIKSSLQQGHISVEHLDETPQDNNLVHVFNAFLQAIAGQASDNVAIAVWIDQTLTDLSAKLPSYG